MKKMSIVIAPDKFKGSLRAEEVCDAITSAITDGGYQADIECVPMADGGDGTCGILTLANGGRRRECQVVDPLGRTLKASYGVSVDGTTAYVEMAAASGLILLKRSERDPLRTSTFGTGLMIRDAIGEVVLGVGGSATNDGGMGMAAALGYRFLDREGKELQPSGAGLARIHSIELVQSPLIRELALTVLCDVKSPLYGSQGAAFVFSPQKGADDTGVRLLDDGLRNLAAVVEKQWHKNMNFEGAGAGGGIAAGAHIFLDGKIVSGVQYVMKELRIEDRIRNADLIITGEGALDEQSLSGKVVSGISGMCRRYEKPFVVFCGINRLNSQQEKELGAAGIYSIVRDGISEKIAIANAAALLNGEARKLVAELCSGGHRLGIFGR
jgi:glycerate 2-kinase